MSILQILPALAYLGCVCAIWMIAKGTPTRGTMAWAVPVVLGAGFAVFSIITVAQEGLPQFWVNHSTSLAGNQVWFDLLFAVTIAFYLIAPRARAVGMPIWPWALAVVATACVALLPMLARMIWLEQRGAR